MNEDENGITPAEVTAMSIEHRDGLWYVIIEQGNGDIIKEIDLTEMERMQLAAMLGTEPGSPSHHHVEFVDFTRHPHDGGDPGFNPSREHGVARVPGPGR